MIEISEMERYLRGLYEAYDALHTEYKNLHKRSRMHDMETAENYYRRWKGKMLEEIGRVEKELVMALPIVNGECLMFNEFHSQELPLITHLL